MDPPEARTPSRRPRGPSERALDGGLVARSLIPAAAALVVLLLTTTRPGPLPEPALPPVFDGATATALARELARQHPSRVPGSLGGFAAARWVQEKLSLYGLRARVDVWREDVLGVGRVQLRNLAVVVPGQRSERIAFVAHRDNRGTGPGASDNASGTAALLELARAYAKGDTVSARARPRHTLVFLFSDGGAYGSLGARRFALVSPLGRDVRAVVSLDALGGRDARVEIAGDGPRSPLPALVRTVTSRVERETGRPPETPGILRQLVDLAFPYAYGEQGRFLGESVSALRLTTADDSGASDAFDDPELLRVARVTELGRAAQASLDALDAGVELTTGTGPYVLAGERVVRGWAVALVLLAALVPVLVGSLDVVVRLRRNGVPIAPAFRAMRDRLAIWLLAAPLLWVASATGLLPDGAPVALTPSSAEATRWVPAALALVVLPPLAVWWVRRRRLAPAGPVPVPGVEQHAGIAAALLTLTAVALVTFAVNPYALAFLVPSLYAWLFLLTVQRPWLRDLVYAAGLAGPILLVVSLATRYDLGLEVVPYLLSLVSVGYLSWMLVVAALVWAAAAGQVGTVVAGRYAPLRARSAPEAVAQDRRT